MVKDLGQKTDSEYVELNLPRQNWSTLSHKDNIDYCIRELRKASGTGHKKVIGYTIKRGWGTRESNHMIISKSYAETQRKNRKRFDYFTLQDLLQEKESIKQGKYKMDKGLIIGLNPGYS